MKLESGRQKLGVGGWCAALIVAAGGVGACGNSFSSDCKASRTCPNTEGGAGGAAPSTEGGANPGDAPNAGSGRGGEPDTGEGASSSGGTGAADSGGAPGLGGAPPQAGQSGDAGAGGEPVVVIPDCYQAADCDDHVACNGLEQCDASGHCIAGTPPVCANPDAAHCAVACTEGAGTYQCAVTALDADKDGHTSALCAAKPGDDCDDAQKTVYTGAPELCDRLDNDCDTKIDLADGLKFSGKEQTVNSKAATIAWSPELQLYGMAWHILGVPYAALYDAKGNIKAGPRVLSGDSAYELAIAPGPKGFGVVWKAQDVYFQAIAVDGNLTNMVPLTGREGLTESGLALAWSGSAKRWEVAADHGLAAVSADGVGQPFVHYLAKTVTVTRLELVPSGSSLILAVSGLTGTAPNSRVYAYAPGTSPGPANELPFQQSGSASTEVHVAARSDGSFAIAAHSDALDEASHITTYDKSGTKLCAYKDSVRVTGIAATGTGYTLARVSPRAADSRLGLSFLEVTPACVAGQVAVANTFRAVYGEEFPSIAASPTSYAAVWSWDEDGESYYSFFGSNFCN
jgi:hypothetical protein